MSYCPSMDWERHVEELDASAESEFAFWNNSEHQKMVAAVAGNIVSALISNHGLTEWRENYGAVELVDIAGSIVFEIVSRGELP